MNCGDDTEVRTKTNNNEAKQGHIEKLDEYDSSLDIFIAMRKGIRLCPKHPICNYVSYDNISPQFKTFTASRDSTIISKNIYTVLKCPECKNVVMEEMKALEKNSTFVLLVLYPRDTKLQNANVCSLSNTKQMVLLTDTRQGQLQKDLLKLWY